MELDILKSIKIGVLGGGVSEEREISLLSAQNVYSALRKKNIEAVFIDLQTSKKEEVKKIITSYNIDIVFIALHGKFGEDGELQSILDEMRITYTGSSSLASYYAMNKVISKKIFLEKGIPTPDFYVYTKGERIPEDIKYPLVIKPYFSGSSLGVSIVKKDEELENALKKAFSFQVKVIFEDYIEGRELTVGILEEQPLEVVEIIPQKKDYFDFHTKYTDGEAEFIVPTDLEKRIYEEVKNIALKAHFALRCRDFSRVDIRLSKDNIPYVLEVNSIPGLTSHSLLPLCAKAKGLDFEDLILKMLILAVRRSKEEIRSKV